MRYLLSLCLLIGAATPTLANPFEEKPKNTQPDYDKVPNNLPIGLGLQELDADTLSAFGIEGQSVGLAITQIQQGSVASLKGFATGDVITHINDEPIKGTKHYEELVNRALPNSKVVIKFYRHGSFTDVELFRVHAYGIQFRYERLRSRFWPSLNDCRIDKYNNKDPKTIKMIDVFKHKFAVFMIDCAGKAPKFIKINKKKFFGLWSELMSSNLRSNYGWL